MQRFEKRREEGALVTYKYDKSVTELGRLVPETQKKKRKNLIEEIKEKVEREDW